jgi:hypothetical protein
MRKTSLRDRSPDRWHWSALDGLDFGTGQVAVTGAASGSGFAIADVVVASGCFARKQVGR